MHNRTFFTAWLVVASAFTVTGGLIAVKLTHHYTHTRELQMLEEKRRREKEDVAETREAEFLYICTELIFRLEEFAEKCAFVAADSGIQPLKDEEWVASTPTPVLTLEDIDGEWKSIPASLLYLIRELPARQRAIASYLVEVNENRWELPENKPWFDERKKQYAWIGLRAIRLARRLDGYPETRLADGMHSPMQAMWDVRRHDLRHS